MPTAIIDRKQLGTHFIDLKNGWYLCFSIDTCERCGQECEAPNAMRIAPNPKQFGLKEMQDYLPELFYNEDFKGHTCSDC